jgi:hypothetical protein
MTAVVKTVDPIQDTIPRGQAKTLRSEIKSCVKQKIDIDFELCKLLFYSKAGYVADGKGSIPFFEFCGYGSWDAYITGELEITPSKARRYAAVYSKYAIELGEVFSVKKHLLDINKMILLMPVVTEENLDKMIESARNATKEEMVSVLGKKKSTLNFKLFLLKTSDKKVLEKALSKAALEFGDDLGDSALLMAILSEYIGK